MLSYVKFPKIDAHMHLNIKDTTYIEEAQRNNVHLITINTDAAVFPNMDEQENVATYLLKQYPKHFSYVAGFSMQDWNELSWLDKTKKRIANSMARGAIGVKIWKNIGMEIRKNKGDFLMVDDPFFYPLFDFLTKYKIPLLAHLGEPKNCWLPLEQMTTHRNRLYYEKHPEFHMHLHPEYPSYEQHIEARDRILLRYPQLNFIGAHLGSVEWSYKELSHRLDRYSNFQVDLSSRLNHLQLQAIEDYQGVHDFFMKYADRILYGTDVMDNLPKMKKVYPLDWLFLATDDILESDEIDGRFRGMKLPKKVLEKIYYNNALKYYPALRNRMNYI